MVPLVNMPTLLVCLCLIFIARPGHSLPLVFQTSNDSVSTEQTKSFGPQTKNEILSTSFSTEKTEGVDSNRDAGGFPPSSTRSISTEINNTDSSFHQSSNPSESKQSSPTASDIFYFLVQALSKPVLINDSTLPLKPDQTLTERVSINRQKRDTTVVFIVHPPQIQMIEDDLLPTTTDLDDVVVEDITTEDGLGSGLDFDGDAFRQRRFAEMTMTTEASPSSTDNLVLQDSSPPPVALHQAIISSESESGRTGTLILESTEGPSGPSTTTSGHVSTLILESHPEASPLAPLSSTPSGTVQEPQHVPDPFIMLPDSGENSYHATTIPDSINIPSNSSESGHEALSRRKRQATDSQVTPGAISTSLQPPLLTCSESLPQNVTSSDVIATPYAAPSLLSAQPIDFNSTASTASSGVSISVGQTLSGYSTGNQNNQIVTTGSSTSPVTTINLTQNGAFTAPVNVVVANSSQADQSQAIATTNSTSDDQTITNSAAANPTASIPENLTIGSNSTEAELGNDTSVENLSRSENFLETDNSINAISNNSSLSTNSTPIPPNASTIVINPTSLTPNNSSSAPISLNSTATASSPLVANPTGLDNVTTASNASDSENSVNATSSNLSVTTTPIVVLSSAPTVASSSIVTGSLENNSATTFVSANTNNAGLDNITPPENLSTSNSSDVGNLSSSTSTNSSLTTATSAISLNASILDAAATPEPVSNINSSLTGLENAITCSTSSENATLPNDSSTPENLSSGTSSSSTIGTTSDILANSPSVLTTDTTGLAASNGSILPDSTNVTGPNSTPVTTTAGIDNATYIENLSTPISSNIGDSSSATSTNSSLTQQSTDVSANSATVVNNAPTNGAGSYNSDVLDSANARSDLGNLNTGTSMNSLGTTASTDAAANFSTVSSSGTATLSGITDSSNSFPSATASTTTDSAATTNSSSCLCASYNSSAATSTAVDVPEKLEFTGSPVLPPNVSSNITLVSVEIQTTAQPPARGSYGREIDSVDSSNTPSSLSQATSTISAPIIYVTPSATDTDSGSVVGAAAQNDNTTSAQLLSSSSSANSNAHTSASTSSSSFTGSSSGSFSTSNQNSASLTSTVPDTMSSLHQSNMDMSQNGASTSTNGDIVAGPLTPLTTQNSGSSSLGATDNIESGRTLVSFQGDNDAGSAEGISAQTNLQNSTKSSRSQVDYTVSNGTGLYYSVHENFQKNATTSGSYRVLLPDGRMEIVTYTADETGYHPVIEYENIKGETRK